jgi:hypothetical protein
MEVMESGHSILAGKLTAVVPLIRARINGRIVLCWIIEEYKSWAGLICHLMRPSGKSLRT